MDKEPKVKGSDIISAWIKELEKHRLVPKAFPLPNSFIRSYLVCIILCSTVLSRIGLLFCPKDNEQCNFILGGCLYPFPVLFAKTLYSGVIACTLLVLGIYCILVKRMKMIYELMNSELVPYVSSPTTPLFSDRRGNFLRRMKIILFVVKINQRNCFLFGSAILLYSHTVCILRETSWWSSIYWCLWASTQIMFVKIPMSNTLLVIGLWYAFKTHFNMQVEQLTEQTTQLLHLDSCNLFIKFTSLLKTYRSLVIKIKKFNSFSKELCFWITICNTVWASCLLASSHFVSLKNEPLITSFLFIYWLVFEFGSVAVLAASSSLFEKSQSLYRILNQFYVRKLSDLPAGFKFKLRSMVKNTGSRSHCPLALVNIDDRVYDFQILGRYIIYNFRMVIVIARLINHLDRFQ